VKRKFLARKNEQREEGGAARCSEETLRTRSIIRSEMVTIRRISADIPFRAAELAVSIKEPVAVPESEPDDDA
jgi:hypothetical protein